LAQKRLARGCRLNHVETIALLSGQLLEFIRDGRHGVAELMDLGRHMLGRRHVLPSVPWTVYEVQIEGYAAKEGGLRAERFPTAPNSSLSISRFAPTTAI
jgi:urease gamma subunit